MCGRLILDDLDAEAQITQLMDSVLLNGRQAPTGGLDFDEQDAAVGMA